MGSTQGEIRIGQSHQAKLPENRLNLNSLESSPDPEFSKEREESRWVPSVTLDGDLVMYLRAARSMAAFAGMCDGGSAEDGCIAARRDETTMNAMDVLHDCNYDPSKALQTLVKCPVPKSIEKKWTEEETKRFVKGLRQFGKNFFRIKKDLLPHKDTPELVEFYYLWKKTPGANNNRPHRRRRQGSLRRNRNTRNSRGGTPKEEVTGGASRPPSSKDQGEQSSGSDDDNDNSYDDSDSRENGGYRCQHCSTTTSRDWLHASNGPKQGALLCSTCHSYYKQFGDLPPTPRSETYLFQPVQTDSPEGSPGRMRTRNKTKETPTKEKSKSKRSEVVTPEPETDKKPFNNIAESKSPSTAVTSPGDKSKRKGKTETNPSRKRSNILQPEGEAKRKREHGPDSGSGESDCESLLDEINASSPAQNVEDKCAKAETPTAPPLLPIAELSRNDDEPPSVKMETEEPTMAPSDVFSNADSPSANNDSVDHPASTAADEGSTANSDAAGPAKPPFDYESVSAVKTESGVFAAPPERDEILPPILTSEECYVPKDEMPTLQANTNLAETAASAPSPYLGGGYVSQMDASVDIKTEPGLQMTDENGLPELPLKSARPESPAQQQRPSLSPGPPLPPPPPSAFPSQNSTSPSSALPYPQAPPVSPRLADANSEKVSPPNSSTVLPGYGFYAENERGEKFLPQAPVPPSTLNLSQHPQNVPYPPFYHYPPHSSSYDKPDPSAYAGMSALQMEPQDLKIKQETPIEQQRSPSVDPLQSLKEVKVPGYPSTSISQPLLPTSTNSSVPLAAIDSHGPRSNTNSPSFAANVAVDDIKKESSSDLYAGSRVTTPLKSPGMNAATAKLAAEGVRGVSHSPKLSHTPPYHAVGSASALAAAAQQQQQQLPPPPSSISASARTPTSSPISTPSNAAALQTATAPQQPSPLNRASPAHLAHPHPYMPPIHPSQHYFQHPLFASAAAAQVAAHAMHHQYSHPSYAGYPYGFPYPSPYPIPQPIPPPRPLDNVKREADGGTTLMTSHHSSSSSSSVTTRSLRDDDSNVHSQEITQMHHHSQSHHSSVHHHNEKQTISHSSSSSSSASVQHKVKRSSSPQHSSATCHVSATLSQSTSSSVSTNHGQSTHHSHLHQHTHHHQSATAESPQLLNMPLALGASNPRNGATNPSLTAAQSKSHSSPMLPGPSSVLAGHHPGLPLPGLPGAPHVGGSLEALRAHAHAIHPPMVPTAPHALGHGGYLGAADMSLTNSELMKPDPALMQSNDDSMMNAAEEDDILSPTNHVPKGPSPEPKIEDSECHRSQSAIFLRHWNRGDYNSCARTDLTFKPVPDSKLDKKRQERIRKQAEKEREEREKNQARKITTPDKPETTKPPSRGPIETITSPYDRFARGAPFGDAAALRQLGEYGRPHAGFSPVPLTRATASLLPPQCIDPMLHYQLNMYGPARERLELEHFEREKRDREIRELREKELNERLKEEMMKSAGARLANPMDQHWLDLRRFNALAPTAPGALHPFGLYAAPGQPALSPLERDRLERLVYLDMIPAPYSRGTLIQGRDGTIGIHPGPELLARPYADQLIHQAAAHDHMQRQMLLERERYSHPAIMAQHEEYLRLQQQQQQRDHESKFRAFEEAARAGRS